MRTLYHNFITILQESCGSLPNNIPYFGATKAQFLERLKIACEQFELMGETKVSLRNLPFNSDYYYACFPTICIALPFYLKRNEKDEIEKFYHHREEKFIEEIKDQEVADKSWGFEAIMPFPNIHTCEIYFRKDERIGFQQTEEYLKYKHMCDHAVEKIHSDKTQIIFTPELINKWLWEHQLFFHEIKNEWNIKAYVQFLEIYFYCTLFKDKLIYSDQAKEAVLSFHPSEQDDILDWLDKYNRLYFCHMNGEEEHYKILDERQYILQDAYRPNWFYKGEEFYYLHQYSTTFTSYYNEYERNNPDLFD